MLTKPKMNKLKMMVIIWGGHTALSKMKNPNLELFQIKLKQFSSTISHKFDKDFTATLSRPKIYQMYLLTYLNRGPKLTLEKQIWTRVLVF